MWEISRLIPRSYSCALSIIETDSGLLLRPNVIVRYLTRDNESGFKKSCRLINDAESIYVSTSVMLELVWVLSSAYSLSPRTIHDSLLKFVRLKNMHVENAQNLKEALNLYKSGMDIADAIHISNSGKDISFYTFDSKLMKKASTVGYYAVKP